MRADSRDLPLETPTKPGSARFEWDLCPGKPVSFLSLQQLKTLSPQCFFGVGLGQLELQGPFGLSKSSCKLVEEVLSASLLTLRNEAAKDEGQRRRRAAGGGDSLEPHKSLMGPMHPLSALVHPKEGALLGFSGLRRLQALQTPQWSRARKLGSAGVQP